MSRSLRLDCAQGAMAAVRRRLSRLAGGDRLAGRVVDVLAQEDLVRGVRRVGLALVDERRVGVWSSGRRRRCGSMPSGPGRIVAAGQGHEPQLGGRSSPLPRMWSGPATQRVVGLQRHEDGAVAAVGDLVEAVVEELAEDREQRVERRRQADVGRDVRDEERLVRRHAAGRDVTGGVAGSASSCTARRPGCPACGPGSRPRRWPPGWSRSGRRSGCRSSRGWRVENVARVARSVERRGRAEERRVRLRRPEHRRRQPREASGRPRRTCSWPGIRLLQEPSTVRSPKDSSGLGDLVGAGADHRLAVDRVAASGSVAGRRTACAREWRSAILICLRMNARSEGVTVKPWPTGPAALAAGVRSARVPVGSIATPVHASAATNVHVRGRARWPSTARRRDRRRPSGGERCIWLLPLRRRDYRAGGAPVAQGVRGHLLTEDLGKPFERRLKRRQRIAEFSCETFGDLMSFRVENDSRTYSTLTLDPGLSKTSDAESPEVS